MTKVNHNLWQSEDWEVFQRELKRSTIRDAQENLIIMNPLWGKVSYGYIPRGPQKTNKGAINSFITEIKKEHPQMAFLLCDPVEELTLPSSAKSAQSHSPQPEATIVLDLTLREEELLKQMKRKGRYNIGLAEKKGVVVKKASNEKEQQEALNHFMSMLTETTSRDGFSGHGRGYYATMLKSLKGCMIYTATKDDRPLASAIIVHHGETAIYYYGASSNSQRELMAPYLVQWTAICDAKKAGLKNYDFLGIAPEGASKNHPWAGVTTFKKKFGGEIVSYPKAIDVIFSSLHYRLYQLLKFFRKLLS